MFIRTLLLLGLFFVTAPAVEAGGSKASDDWRQLAKTAMSADGPSVDRAIAELRDGGPVNLRLLLATYDRVAGARDNAVPAKSAKSASAVRDTASIERMLGKLESVIDRVAGQRYGHVSRLYWYTDLERAKAAAAESGKPILSLRMLGNLTDEFSCANSRFFRTTLYANQEIASRLGERFVLHWKSVRPVPRVTIDFGDGRKLERTLTGNSAHYVLAADGAPLDVLPGLYGPRQFLAWLSDMENLHAQVRSLGPSGCARRLRSYHAGRSEALARQLRADLLAVDSAASDIAGDPGQLAAGMNAEQWHAVASLERHRVELDAASRRTIRRENPNAALAGAIAVTKSRVEDPILRLVRTLQQTIAVDSVRNEYTLHQQAHDWFAAGTAGNDIERLNERVYSLLFLTPTDDPWLGLAPPDTYTALSGGGVVASGR